MRLVISLCRYCIRKPGECEYREKLLAVTKAAKFKATVVHNCSIYRTLVPVVSLYKQGSGDFNVCKTREEIIADGKKTGARVRLMLKELEIGTSYRQAYDEADGTTYEWVDAGEVMGTIVFAPNGKSKFFGVRLDDPVDLVLPEGGKSWNTAHEQRIEDRWLPANKLDFVKVEK